MGRKVKVSLSHASFPAIIAICIRSPVLPMIYYIHSKRWSSTYNFHSTIFHPILPSVDSTLTVNIFLLCGNFPISPPFYQFAAFLPWGIGGIRNIGSRTHSVHLALLSCHRKGFRMIHLQDLDWYVC